MNFTVRRARAASGVRPLSSALPGPVRHRVLLSLALALAFIAPSLSASPALAEAIDQPALTVSTSGDAPWFAQSITTSDGADAAQSGGITGRESSTLSTLVTGAASVSFRWKVSSLEGHDCLRFYIDDVEQASPISGEVGWQSRTYELPTSGSHRLSWRYTKNGYGRNHQDRGWVDRLKITYPTPPVIVSGPDDASLPAGGNAAFAVAAEGGTLSFQWYRGSTGDTGQPLPGATGPFLVTPPLSESTSYWARISNPRGTVDSRTVTASVITLPGQDLWGMGWSPEGQLGLGIRSVKTPPGMIADGVAQGAAGYAHSLFIKTDGSLWASGENADGQLGDGSGSDQSTPVQVAIGVIHAAAGISHSLFVKSDGTLWGMGELGLANHARTNTPVQIATHVAMAAAGNGYSLFITTDGTLWGFGANYDGQLGDGTRLHRSAPVLVTGNVAQVTAGSGHSLFVKNDGTLWAMGAEEYHRLLGTGVSVTSTPVQVASQVSRVATGYQHTLFIKTDATLWSVGRNTFGQLGNGTSTDSYAPVQIATEVARIAANQSHSLFMKTDGTLWSMGYNSLGELGDGAFLPRHTPVQVAAGVAEVAAGGAHNLFVKADGTLWTMGYNGSGQLGYDTSRPAPVSIADDVTRIGVATMNSAFIKADGTLWVMGSGTEGQLGNGTQGYQAGADVPVQIATDVRRLALGYSHGLFLKADGTLWGMGNNSNGQLGDGTYLDRSTPVMIASDVVDVVAADNHGLFVKTDGSLWGMGSNPGGQLGETIGHLNTPISIADGVAHVATSGSHTLLLKADGSLWSMGSNNDGQLGNGTSGYNTNVLAPGKIADRVVQASAGGSHSLFVTADGTLWACGSGVLGQLADGVSSYDHRQRRPVPVATGVRQAVAGDRHSLFIKTDHTLWVAGNNEEGQLGDGTRGYQNQRTTPVQIATGVTQVATTSHHSLFIKAPMHSVTFDPGSLGTRTGGGTLAQRVLEGLPALAPAVTANSAEWSFQGWDTAFDHITADLTVHAVYLRTQTITFAPPAPRIFKPAGGNTLTLSATAGSGLPVTFAVVSGPATLGGDGRTLTFTDAGIVVLRATQPGDGTWAAAPSIEHALVIKGAGLSQKITFAPPAVRTYGDTPLALAASASSGLPVTFQRVAGPASLQNGLLTFHGAGRVVIKAVQPGGNGFGAAPEVTRTITIRKASLTVQAEDAFRLAGAANPPFTLTYAGFVGDDTPASLDRPPVGTSKATAMSPQGAYPITLKGGADNDYLFVPGTPGTLAVLGFAGSYEALLGNELGIAWGKLELVVARNSLAYTGRLTLVNEASVIPLRGRLAGAADFSHATGSWHRTAGGTATLNLGFQVNGEILSGTLSRNGEAFLTFSEDAGTRLYTSPKRLDAPWSGNHTLVLAPPIPADPDTIPAGPGNATAIIAPATGALALKGGLADGTPFTGSALPDTTGRYRLLLKPYGDKRPDSYLSGSLDLIPHPGLPGRYYIPFENGLLYWAKSESPAKPMDKSYRGGFSPRYVYVTLDPWLPPIAARPATATTPATDPITLAQRLGLATDNVSAAAAVSFARGDLDLGESAELLPTLLTLDIAGAFSVAEPATTPPNLTRFALKVTPATGAFSGSFILVDGTDLAKPTTRKVEFSGTFRQTYEDDFGWGDELPLGTGVFLLPPLPGAESTEHIPGEIRLTRP